MKPRHWLWIFLLALTSARLWCLGNIELSPDESYHWLWSQHPDWCYYDKGPGIATAIRAGTALFGVNEFGVRFFSPLLALGTSLALFGLARRFYGEALAVWTVVIVNLLPVFQSGSLMMTSGALSIFFWSAAMLTFWIALERGPAFSFYWPATGLLVGAGFLAEYANALELVSMALVLASAGKFRREFMRPGFWVMLISFVPCTIPAFLWNAQHEWITWLSWRGQLGVDGFSPIGTLKFLAHCAMGYSPLIFAGMMIALVWGLQKARTQFKSRFFLLFALPLLSLEVLLSPWKPVAMETTAPALLGLVVLSVALWQEATQACGYRKFFVFLAAGTGLTMSLFYTGIDLLNGPAGLGAPPTPMDSGPRTPGWKSAAFAVDFMRKKFEHDNGKPVFLIGSNDGVASVLAFYLPDKRVEIPGHPPVYIPESQMIESQFSYWPRYDEFVAAPKEAQPSDSYYTEEQGTNPFMGRTALFISDEESPEPPTAIKNGFERVELIGAWPLKERAVPERNLHVYECFNYRSVPL